MGKPFISKSMLFLYMLLIFLVAFGLLFTLVLARDAKKRPVLPEVSPEESGEETSEEETEEDESGLSSVSDVPVVEFEPVTFTVTHSEPTFTAQELNADYGALFDLDRKKLVIGNQVEDRIYPASLTKVMTVLIAIENVTDWEDTFTFRIQDIDPLITAGASRAGFYGGETVTIRDLLYGAALPSGADATLGLALYVSGSEEEYVKLMNQKAAELGCTNTHFCNASGLHDDNHYTTMKDMAQIFAYGLQNPLFLDVLSAKTYTSTKTKYNPNGITMYSTTFSRLNAVEGPKNATVIAGKTGYTDEAKYCLITYAVTKTNHSYILITAHGSSVNGKDGNYQPLYDLTYVYNTYTE